VVIGPGCSRMGSDARADRGDLPGRVCLPLGLPGGRPARPSREMPVHGVEFREGFAIARTEVTVAQYRRYRPEPPRGRLSSVRPSHRVSS